MLHVRYILLYLVQGLSYVLQLTLLSHDVLSSVRNRSYEVIYLLFVLVYITSLVDEFFLRIRQRLVLISQEH